MKYIVLFFIFTNIVVWGADDKPIDKIAQKVKQEVKQETNKIKEEKNILTKEELKAKELQNISLFENDSINIALDVKNNYKFRVASLDILKDKKFAISKNYHDIFKIDKEYGVLEIIDSSKLTLDNSETISLQVSYTSSNNDKKVEDLKITLIGFIPKEIKDIEIMDSDSIDISINVSNNFKFRLASLSNQNNYVFEISKNYHDIFKINQKYGLLELLDSSKLVLDDKDTIEIEVVKKSLNDNMTQNIKVTINLLDFIPQSILDLELFEDENIKFIESVANGYKFRVASIDKLKDHIFTIVSNYQDAFSIDPKYGAIEVVDTSKLDYESNNLFYIEIASKSNINASTSVIKLKILLENDHSEFIASELKDISNRANTIIEGARDGSKVGITLLSQDEDEDDFILYSISKNYKNAFTVDKSTGIITVYNGSDLDYKKQEFVMIETMATSTDGSISKKEFQIKVKENRMIPVADDNILIDEYMLVKSIRAHEDPIKDILTTEDEIVTSSYGEINFFDKKKAELQRSIIIKNTWVNSIVTYKDKIIGALGDGSIGIWDYKSGELLNTLNGHKLAVLSLAISNDTLVSSSKDGSIIIWNLENEELVYKLSSHQWDVSAIAIDGNILYSGSDDYSIKKWDIKTGKLLDSFKSAHDGAINDILVTDKYLISCSDDKSIKVRDIHSLKTLYTLLKHKKAVLSISMYKDMLISTSADRSILVWDIKQQKPLKRFKSHSKSVISSYVDSGIILSGSNDYNLKFWGFNEAVVLDESEDDESSKAKYEQVKSLQASNHAILSLNKTENEIITTSFSDIMFWNATTLEYERSYSSLDIIPIVEKKEEKKDVLVDEELDGFDIADEEEEEEDSEEEEEDEEDEDSEEDEEELKLYDTTPMWINSSSINGNLFFGAIDRVIKVWDLENNILISTIEGHTSTIKSLYSNQEYLVSTSLNGIVNVWSLEDFSLVYSLDGHQFSSTAAVIYENIIITAGEDGTIRYYDMENDTDMIIKIKTAHNGAVNALLIYKDYLISVGDDGLIRYRNISTGKLLFEIKAHNSSITSIYYNEEQHHLVTGSKDKEAKVWNIDTRELVATLKGHKDEITSVITTDDYIVTGSKDKTIKLWKYYE